MNNTINKNDKDFEVEKDTTNNKTSTLSNTSTTTEFNAQDFLNQIRKVKESILKKNETIRKLFKDNNFDYDKDALLLPYYLKGTIPTTKNVVISEYVNEATFIKGRFAFFNLTWHRAGIVE